MWNKDTRRDAADPSGFDGTTAVRGRVTGHPFKADVDVAELDDRSRPGPAWAARAQALSRSHVVLMSRRMSYPKRVMLVAIHLIDARPTPLMGRVSECEYYADGLYRLVLELMALPEPETVALWFPGGNLK